MCGLVVVVERKGCVDRKALGAALAQLAHRGPDARQTAIVSLSPGGSGSGAEIGLAHGRLAIIDLDERSNQPFQHGDHWLAYNGEIYNFREIAAGLKLSTCSDTEVLLSILMREGVEALRKANGMWAFCWYDPAAKRLTAARDRYGKKPLFYLITPERACFASEPGALLTVAGMAPVARAPALDSFVAEGWLFPSRDGTTCLEGVRELPPGSALELDIDSWSWTERQVTPPGFEAPVTPGWDSEDELVVLLTQAVGARLVSDRKMALLLSGGIDSSLILSVLAANGWLDRVVCVTGDAGKSEDAAFAQACLDQLGVKGLSLSLDYGEAGLSHFLDVCAAQGKPFPLIGNVLGMASLYRAIAAEGVSVAIDGTGADEIFGGYWYRQAGFAMRDAARRGDRAWLARIRACGMLPPGLAGVDDGMLANAALSTPARDVLTESDRTMLTGQSRIIIDAAFSTDPLVDFAGTFPQALRLDASAGRMQEWLWQNDRNAMAAGVENRSPFLDYRLAPFASSTRLAKFDGNLNKRELRRLFNRFVPLPTANRVDKQGFRWVYGRFLRNNAPELLDLLLSSAIVGHYVRESDLVRLFGDGERLGQSKLVQRLMVLAGLERRGCLVSPFRQVTHAPSP